MSNVRISQLPSAPTSITGTELVPIVQNGQTVQTTVSALTNSPSLTQTFLTVNNETTLANSRYLGATNGLAISDGGAQSVLNVTSTGALLSLVNSGNGFQVKTSSTVITNRTITISGNGLAITNGSGVSGDPVIALSGQVLNFANASFNGLVVLSTGGAITSATITGTASQIDVANGTGIGGNPTLSISSDPTLPGTGGVALPSGTTLQRSGSPTNGVLRYNTTTGLLEAYLNSVWTSLASGSGVTSIATGTGLTGGPITSTGTISIDVTGVTAATYGSSLVVPVIAVNAQGQITSATNTTINAITLTTGTISTTPSASTDIANKSYVDTVAQGLDTKASVVAATTVNITLSGTQTIDGIALIAADRCLVKNQTLSQNNGIYDVAAGAWTRSSDMNTWAQVPGAYVFVEQGTTQADTGWVCTSDAGGTLGTTAITWAQFSGAGSGVSSITFGTTGLTPATATTGAVTVAGTLAVANGGTNITSYAVGDLIYASTTGILSKLVDVATGNALISGGVGAAPSYGKIALTTHVSGTLPVANGGTGLTAGTSGGILAYTASGTLASSALLTQYGIVYGGGAGAVPVSTAAGTTGQVLQATTSGAPVWGTTYAGTVTSVSFTGGIVSVATATTTPALTVAGTSGGIPYFSSGTTWATSALLTASALMIGGGAGVAPSTTTTGTGILTFLGTPSSANLAAAVTDETGSGSLVFGTSPAFTTSITTASTTFTALAGATTLLTIGGTGATAVVAHPGTLEQTGTTGALTVAGGVYVAKILTAIGGISGGTF